MRSGILHSAPNAAANRTSAARPTTIKHRLVERSAIKTRPVWPRVTRGITAKIISSDSARGERMDGGAERQVGTKLSQTEQRGAKDQPAIANVQDDEQWLRAVATPRQRGGRQRLSSTEQERRADISRHKVEHRPQNREVEVPQREPIDNTMTGKKVVSTPFRKPVAR